MSFLEAIYPLKYPSNACLSYLDNGLGVDKYQRILQVLYSTKYVIYSQQKHEITGKLIATYACQQIA